MFKVGQKVVFTKKSDYVGIRGAIAKVDESDCMLPYCVDFEDEDGKDATGWFYENDIEADGEVIE